MNDKMFMKDVNHSKYCPEIVDQQQLDIARATITNLSFLPQGQDVYHKNRSQKSLQILKDVVENKFLCHIGCASGIMTEYFSKACSKILAIDIEDEPIIQASRRKYNCETDIKKADAIKYLQENTEINPEVFYLWTNYTDMRDWVEKIIELRGHTNPTIILGIGMQKVVSPVENGEPLQLKEAKKLKEKYNGSIQLVAFPIVAKSRNVFTGAFGLLILKGLK